MISSESECWEQLCCRDAGLIKWNYCNTMCSQRHMELGHIIGEQNMTRFFDVLFSLIAVIILTPFMIPIMIGLKLTGEHYIYEQERIGKGGKPFMLLKFATMLKDSPNMTGGFYTAENDPRILPMGKFLRKTKINELPQLLNILKGDMSVIGYRPQVKKQYNSYSPEVRKAMSKSRPGLSGIGPIVFRSEEQILQRFHSHEERDAFYKNVITPYKGKLEVWYSKHRNVIMYFRLIFMTVEVVLNPDSKSWTKLRGIPKPPKELEEYL